jgi:hypothetical protein
MKLMNRIHQGILIAPTAPAFHRAALPHMPDDFTCSCNGTETRVQMAGTTSAQASTVKANGSRSVRARIQART